MKQIGANIRSGLAWSFINQVVGQVVFVAFNIYLSRLLGPAAFGIIGMVTLFSGFASYFVEAGFGSAIIQKKDITPSQVSTVFWVNIAMGVLLFLLFFLGAPYLAVFYHQPELILLSRVISITFIASALSVVQNSLIIKQMNFRRKTALNWLSLCIAYIVALAMAYLKMGYWAVAGYLVVNATVYCVLVWATSTWRPTFHFSYREFREIAPFGLSVLGDTSVNYWARNADNFLIGKYLGAADLGIYSRAYAIMMLPMKNISSVISGVMFPAFSSIQNNVALVRQYYIITIRYVALICFPLMVGLSLLATDFTLIFFGQNWLRMAGILKWLCLLAALQSVLSLNGIIYKSLGKAKTAFIVSIIVSSLLVVSFILGIRLGKLNGLVMAYFITSLVLMLPIYATALKLIQVSLWHVAVQLKAPFAGVAIMAMVLGGIKYFMHLSVNLLSFSLQFLFGGVIYCVVVYGVDKKLLTGIAKQFKKQPAGIMVK